MSVESARKSVIFPAETVDESSLYWSSLSKQHSALTEIIFDVPQSPNPHSFEATPSDSNIATETRISSLKAKIREAWINADHGNPADGKWIFLTQILRLGISSGRGGRWSGARSDLAPPQLEGDDGQTQAWINAVTDQEWEEWEREFEAKKRVRQKVESWNRRLEFSAPSYQSQAKESVPKVTVKAVASASNPSLSKAVSLDPLKDSAPFGFGVVKRSSQKNAANGKPPGPSNPPPTAVQSDSKTEPPPGKRKSKERNIVSTSSSEKIVDKRDKEISPKERDVINNKIPDKDSSNVVGRITDLPDTSNSNTRNVASAPSSEKIIDKGNKEISSKERDVINDKISDKKSPNVVSRITDLPDTSYLQPSFSASHLLTSTPKAQVFANPIDPSPSSPIAKPSSPLSSDKEKLKSTPVIKTYGRRNLSQSQNQALGPTVSLPIIPSPSTPTRERSSANKDTNQNNKRPLPLFAKDFFGDQDLESDARILKKARTMPGFPSVTAALLEAATPPGLKKQKIELESPSSERPNTPKKQAIPTLTDLLASSKKGKKKKKKKKPESSSDKGKEPDNHKVAALHDELVERPSPSAAFRDQALEAGIPAYDEDVLPIPDVFDPYSSQPQLGIALGEIDPPPFDPYAPIESDLDMATPSKSLSSLAGSDSESSDDEGPAPLIFDVSLDIDNFNPLATSTQHPQHPPGLHNRGPFISEKSDLRFNTSIVPLAAGEASQQSKDSWASVYGPASARLSGSGAQAAPASSNPNPFLYTSQRSNHIAEEVDKVDQILEKDLDFGGWLKSDDDEEVDQLGNEESP